jgi:enoyl-CoA hydratase/carnithine racemase
MPAELLQRQEGQTLILTISNPEMRNALGPEIYAAGAQALARVAQDPSVRTVVLTGAGKAFCAGGNLQRILGNREKPRAAQEESLDIAHAWVEQLRACQRPIIAAVEGAAAGAGFALALSCDFIVAARDAVFVMAYTSVGLSPDFGSTWNLGQALPRQLATELVMLGEKIGAERLQQLGVVNRVSEPGQALADALALAQRLNARAPNALASAKSLVAGLQPRTMTEHLWHERQHFVNNVHHANSGIGIRAFMDKKPPSYEDA